MLYDWKFYSGSYQLEPDINILILNLAKPEPAFQKQDLVPDNPKPDKPEPDNRNLILMLPRYSTGFTGI